MNGVPSARRPDVVHACDVLVLDAGRGARFELEAGADFGALADRGKQKLQSHELAAKAAVAGGHDEPHAALP